jgi:hypothetical protein
MNKILTLIIMLGLFCISGRMQAQTDFKPGFIITLSADTLFGDIDSRSDLVMSSMCKFRSKENTISQFVPGEIHSFRFTDGKYYISMVVDGKSSFLEYLVHGKANLYYQRDENDDHYYIDKEGYKLTEIPYTEEVKFINGKQVSHHSQRHIGVLLYFMQDAPELQARISDLGRPEHANLMKLAEDYHNAVCRDEKCIIYAKKQAALKVNFEIVSGFVRFNKVDDIRDGAYYMGGALAHFWVPRTNEKLYLMTGLLYSPLIDSSGRRGHYFKIPVHLEYLAPVSYRIRPTISIGLLSPSYSGGFVLRMSNKVHAGLKAWLNFLPNDNFILIPDKLFNYSILGGIYFDF